MPGLIKAEFSGLVALMTRHIKQKGSLKKMCIAVMMHDSLTINGPGLSTYE